MQGSLNKWMAEIIAHGLFSDEEVEELAQRVIEKEVRGKPVLYVHCLVREKNFPLKSEEGVRQLWLARILGKYGCPTKRVAVEYPITFVTRSRHRNSTARRRTSRSP